jgi:hypothetical protein
MRKEQKNFEPTVDRRKSSDNISHSKLRGNETSLHSVGRGEEANGKISEKFFPIAVDSKFPFGRIIDSCVGQIDLAFLINQLPAKS